MLLWISIVSGLAAIVICLIESFLDGASILIFMFRHFWYDRRLSARKLYVWAERVAGSVNGSVNPPGVDVSTAVQIVTYCESVSRFIWIVQFVAVE